MHKSIEICFLSPNALEFVQSMNLGVETSQTNKQTKIVEKNQNLQNRWDFFSEMVDHRR